MTALSRACHNPVLVVVVGTRGIDRNTLASNIRPGQIVIDLVNLEKSRRVSNHGSYRGICW